MSKRWEVMGKHYSCSSPDTDAPIHTASCRLGDNKGSYQHILRALVQSLVRKNPLRILCWLVALYKRCQSLYVVPGINAYR